MNAQEYLTIVAQTSDGLIITHGIGLSERSAVGIDPRLGLGVMAHNDTHSQDNVKKSVEILLDDMQVNLPSVLQESESASAVGACLRESLDNINEYLLSKHHMQDTPHVAGAMSLIALQFLHNQCSIIAVGDYQCYLLRQEKMSAMLSEPTGKVISLGVDSIIQARKNDGWVKQDDKMLILPVPALKAIGEEFFRVTLTRFSENLDMAIRQLNTRAKHQGLKYKPPIMICHLGESEGRSRRWLEKLGH